MATRAPSLRALVVVAGFALSCFGLGLALWISFGGPVPLGPEGYRFRVEIDEATQLGAESDVRISGVSVGSVKQIELEDSGAMATIELDERYAPIATDARVTVRQKSLLGEMYLEITPGTEGAATVPEGGELGAARFARAVQIDEVLRAFDPATRAAFQEWMQGASGAFAGRGGDLSTAVASLDPFAAQLEGTLDVLEQRTPQVRGLVRDGGQVFDALAERRGELAGMITSADAVFETTARRNQSLREIFTALPSFLREARTTLDRLRGFSEVSTPVVRGLRPAARELRPTVETAVRLAPELRGLFSALRATEERAPRGLRALRGVLGDETPPLLEQLSPFLDELTPILTVLEQRRRGVTALLGNATAATNGVSNEGNGLRNFLRGIPVLNPEGYAAFPQRLRSNRTNPYPHPRGYRALSSGLAGFETSQCSSGIDADLDPATPADPVFQSRFPYSEDPRAEADLLFDGIREFAFDGGESAARVPQPPCREQGPYSAIGGSGTESTPYQHVRRLQP